MMGTDAEQWELFFKEEQLAHAETNIRRATLERALETAETHIGWLQYVLERIANGDVPPSPHKGFISAIQDYARSALKKPKLPDDTARNERQ